MFRKYDIASHVCWMACFNYVFVLVVIFPGVQLGEFVTQGDINSTVIYWERHEFCSFMLVMDRCSKTE